MSIIKTAFLETSAINKCCDNHINGYQLNSLFKQNNIEPVVGMYTLYELARAHNVDLEKAKKLFQFIQQLNPSFCYRKDLLYKWEAEKITDNKAVNYIVNSIDLREKISSRIANYSNGLFTEEDKEFEARRQASLTRDMQNWAPNTFNNEKINPNQMSFLEFVQKYFASDQQVNEIKDIIFINTKIELLSPNIDKFKQNLTSYPALRTLIYSYLYLNYVVKTGRHTPAEDKFTDQLQLIEAAYCNIFISGDEKHLKYANKINSQIECHSIQNYIDSKK